jgi:hypothetical protein
VPVYDPVVEIVFKHTGAQAKDAEWVATPPYTADTKEALEVFRVEVIPPVEAGTGRIKKLKYVDLMIGGTEYGLRINSVMMPAENPNSPSVAVNLGVPYLWRPITGRIPTAIEATCPKLRKGQDLSVKVIAGEDIAAGEDYQVILKCARVRDGAKLVEVVGAPVVDTSFVLDADVYPSGGRMQPVSLDNWDELPGGLKQPKPQVFPWVTWADNAQPTTANQPYDFDYRAKFVDADWKNLSWTLTGKEEAYLVKALGVMPHANLKATRLNVVGRETNEWFTTRPLPERNFFYPAMYYDTSLNEQLRRFGPVFLAKPFLFHGVKGGIQIVDNGTSIPAGGVEVHVYGTKFVLK